MSTSGIKCTLVIGLSSVNSTRVAYRIPCGEGASRGQSDWAVNLWVILSNRNARSETHGGTRRVASGGSALR